MSIDGAICRRGVVKDGGTEPTEVGAGDDEEEDDGDEAGEVEDGGLILVRAGVRGSVSEWLGGEGEMGGEMGVAYHDVRDGVCWWGKACGGGVCV